MGKCKAVTGQFLALNFILLLITQDISGEKHDPNAITA
jgi:hypothetical protein